MVGPDSYEKGLTSIDPLLYDRLIRRFQTAKEREEEGRSKGYSGILEADILRSEAKIEALANPDSSLAIAYKRGDNGEILAEEKEEVPLTKEEGRERFNQQMRWRFLAGNDSDFDYKSIDDSEEYDDLAQERRDAEDRYFDDEEPKWLDGSTEAEHDKNAAELAGETGIQDF